MEFDVELDVRGQNCPLPIIKAMLALKRLLSGQVLRVVTSDKSSPNNMAAFCRTSGAFMSVAIMSEDEHVFLLKRP